MVHIYKIEFECEFDKLVGLFLYQCEIFIMVWIHFRSFFVCDFWLDLVKLIWIQVASVRGRVEGYVEYSWVG